MDGDSRYLKYSIIILSIVGLVLLLAGIFVLEDVVINAPERIELMKSTLQDYGILGLFIAAFLGGTILPMGVPALVAYATGFGMQPLLVSFIASIGFTLGVTINYYLSKIYGRTYISKRIGPEKMDQMVRWWGRYGALTYVIFGLVPGLPVDLLAFICGFFEMPLSTFWAISFSTRMVQFTLFAYMGSFFGKVIGII